MIPPTITLEEHFDSGISHDVLHDNLPKTITDRIHDLGDARLQHMDDHGVNLQVISHAPSATPLEGCRAANDQLAVACRKYPGRYAGFAALPMQDPQAAADELERTVKEYGFLGALINNHLQDGTMYDDRKFWPVFQRAVELDVPIYIHPSFPSPERLAHHKGNFPEMSAILMATATHGWHAECGLHILRLFASGLFDELPKLKVVIGHMGEMLPYMMDRIIGTTRHWDILKRDLRTVWNENIWITTSGMFTLPPLECLLKSAPRDKIMYSVDYPFSGNDKGLDFLKEIEKAGILDDEQMKDFCYRNAEKLLKVKVK